MRSTPLRCRFRSRPFALLSVCLLPACTTLPQLQAPATRLGAAVTAATDAQQAIYTNADSAVQNRKVALYRSDWVTAKPDAQALRGGIPRADPPIPPQELEVRRSVLEGLAAYGQLMTSLAGGSQETALGSSAKAIGQNLKTIATDKGKIGSWAKDAGLSPNTSNIVETAIDGIGQTLIDYSTSRELQQAARSIQSHLACIAAIFKRENINLMSATNANDEIDAARVKTEVAILNDRYSSKAQAYLALRQIDSDFASLQIPADPAPAAAAWDAVVKANGDIVDVKPTLWTDAQDAFERAKAAVSYYQGLQKQLPTP